MFWCVVDFAKDRFSPVISTLAWYPIFPLNIAGIEQLFGLNESRLVELVGSSSVLAKRTVWIGCGSKKHIRYSRIAAGIVMAFQRRVIDHGWVPRRWYLLHD